MTEQPYDEALARRRERGIEKFRFTATRPVAVLMVFLSIMVFGFFSLARLPVNLMPEMSYPTMTVRTEYPGAAPAEVENDVARQLEEVLGVVTGVTQISSVSRAGFADVVLEFGWDADMDDAGQDVLEKLDAVRPLLPDEIKSPLILRYDPTLDPVLVLSLRGPPEQYSGIEGQLALRRIAEQQLKRWIEPLPGVAAVKIKGGLEEEVQVDLDEDALRRSRVSIGDVIDRLSAANVNLAGGNMLDGDTKYLVRTVNEFEGVDEIESLVVRSVDGADIRVKDLATVTRGFKEREIVSRSGGHESIEIEIFKEADANIVAMAKSVNAAIDDVYAKRLSDEFGASLELASDRSKFIESSIEEVRSTAVIGGILAIAVLFLFLREARATVIVSLAIPLSVLMTFAPLAWAGISLNIMSLGGLALGIGMLVDNSIVVLESIHRCREEGDPLIRATLRGVSEVGAAVTASTLTSVAVFFPMVFVEGVAGQLFGDLGLTVVFSLLASLVVALFFIPMLASRTLPSSVASGEVGRRWVYRWTSWSSWQLMRESIAAMRMRWYRWFALPYTVIRFVLGLAFELIGKIIATLVGLLATLFVVVGRFLGSVFYYLTYPILRGFDGILLALTWVYRRILRWSLSYAVVVLLGVFVGTGLLVRALDDVDTELVPELHQGEISIDLSFPVGTPLEETDRIVSRIEQELLATVPRLRSLSTMVGSETDSLDAADRGEHTARFVLALAAGGGQARLVKQQAEAVKRLEEADREDASDETTESTEPAVDVESNVDSDETDEVAGFRSVDVAKAESEAMAAARQILQKVPDLRFTMSRPVLFSFKKPVEVQVFVHDLAKLSEVTQRAASIMEKVPGLRDVQPSIRSGSPEVQILYDRDAIARMGLDVRVIAELIRDKVLGREATKLTRADRKIPIRVRLDRNAAKSADQLRSLVINPGGIHPIPLGAVADVRMDRSPNEIRRMGQQRVGLIAANLEGVALGTAAANLEEALAPLRSLPGVRVDVSGQQEEWDTSANSLYVALGLSIFLVYVIMASQFESLIHPLIILVTIPLGLAGVVVGLSVLGMPVSIVVGLGAIMLVGIVVNNAIVLIDYINQLRERGFELRHAIEEAGLVRLRPILMTTATTVLGLIPMAMGMGDGAEIRQPMAITVITGLTASTCLTLIVIPTLYFAVERLRKNHGAESSSEALEREILGYEHAHEEEKINGGER